MERDPICGMKFNNILDAPRSIYKGSMVYFCCEICKSIFDTNPETYISGMHYELNFSNITPDECDCDKTNLIVHGYRL